MSDNPRKFEAGPDPFGRKWIVTLRWLQNAISIRHSDSVDVKFELAADDGTEMDKVVALMHPYLLEAAGKLGRELSDSWCLRLAGQHVRSILETWDDAEKTIVTPSLEQIQEYAAAVR
ncbi:MAG: hypothetical protein HY235_29790 [Acidobacteria bacterium]|nr:hypothetical protein [Acidobacteriota bacterium]